MAVTSQNSEKSENSEKNQLAACLAVACDAMQSDLVVIRDNLLAESQDIGEVRHVGKQTMHGIADVAAKMLNRIPGYKVEEFDEDTSEWTESVEALQKQAQFVAASLNSLLGLLLVSKMARWADRAYDKIAEPAE